VEFFLASDGLYFSELSPRPHDTGMVTLGGTQNLSEFELHARAVLGLPISGIELLRPGASAVILATDAGRDPQFTGLEEALLDPGADIRIFGKPVTRLHRRMGVALVTGRPGEDVDALRQRATACAAKVSVRSGR
jgi:phosphoribosylglycinamide formyltransferase 2